MIQSIVEYLNDQLTPLKYYTEQHGLIDIITQGDKTFPAKYISGGKYKDISTFNRKGGSCYFRLLGNVSTSVTENNQISCKKMVEFTVPLRFISVIPKNKLKSDNQYSDHELALELIKTFSTKENGLKLTLKAKRVDITTSQWNENSEQVFNDEYVVFGNNQLDSKYSYLYVDIQVSALVSRECIESYCP